MKLSTVLLITLLAFSSSFAQEKRIKIIKNGSQLETALMVEAGVLFAEKDGKIYTENVLPEDVLPEEALEKGKSRPDIKKGDVLVSANGEKFTSAKKLSEWYDGLKPGTEVSLTLDRKGETKSASFSKVEQTGKKRKVFVHVDDTDGETTIIDGDEPGEGKTIMKIKDLDKMIELEELDSLGDADSSATETIIIKKVIRKKKKEDRKKKIEF